MHTMKMNYDILTLPTAQLNDWMNEMEIVDYNFGIDDNDDGWFSLIWNRREVYNKLQIYSFSPFCFWKKKFIVFFALRVFVCIW